MGEGDGDHWLWRLGDREWVLAATRELERGQELLGSRRTAITHARRAAGMGLNGVLVSMAAQGWSREHCETVWGRSYIDHLRSLAAAVDGPETLRGPFGIEACERCRALLEIPVMPSTNLVRLAIRKDEAAVESLEHAAALVAACSAVVGP
jgi:hypothetical protein